MTGLPLDPDLPGVQEIFLILAKKHLGLPTRQAEIAYHMTRGVTTNKEVAALLGLSYQTTKNHVAAMHRHGITTREALICRAWPLYVRAQHLGATIAPLVVEEAA